MNGTEMGDLGMSGMMMCMFAVGLLAVAALATVVVSTVWATRRRCAAGPEDAASAQEQLGRRFAAGEIDEDEFLSRRSLLND